MDPNILARIKGCLAEIERRENVKILLAIESGSRAWGFPSPDSDYDCRFIFVRPPEDYLSIWPKRDVIEVPIDPELDINGWDLGKALKLMLKGNAVVIEWLTSPITYQEDAAFRAELLALANRAAGRSLIGRHYLHLGERQRRTYFVDENAIPQKKIFYALRPAVALRWLRLHPDGAVAPMDFPTLWSDSDAPAEATEIVRDLIARKAQSRELGTEALPKPIRDLIDEEFGLARAEYDTKAPPRLSDAMASTANDMFLKYASHPI